MHELTLEQRHAISVIERACSVLSLLGCIFTIVTFCSSRAFHKPINRLVFYASFGNMLTNVGTLMSNAYLGELDSFGCQFQSFLIQTFMPADAFWTLAMAINVYLTFYHKFDAERLRKMEIVYLLGCYGVPLIPAFTYIFVRNSHGQRIYGNATLWCWISSEYDVLRIATFYGPVWVTILITFFIYIRAGRTIYEKRKQLYEFQTSDPDPLSINGEVVATIKRTEVTVTEEDASPSGAIHLAPLSSKKKVSDKASSASDGAYSVQISADHCPSPSLDVDSPGNTVQQTTMVQVAPQRPLNPARRRHHELNNAAWSYTKCAILFFTAILITWIPSSANRVYSVVHQTEVFPPLEFMSAFVLPLQGLWNAVIYAVTSWSACQKLFNDLMPLRYRKPVAKIASPDPALAEQGLAARKGGQFRSPPRSSHTFDSESMTELAKSHRTASADEYHAC
ncbi:G-protein coupled receptor [Ophiocordyceps camponoti-floridani]|uniref:G-protein coupled receptor n=1 Tax=Ophiocordyceps camponoti-floridani TaxID=2030778 RepID=A0A8H4VBQ4_9HYPO|nr:G-protein coupled receptor [Ophiocordyceps camponoti-floridani]